MPLEIEKKFVLNRLPTGINLGNPIRLSQGYVPLPSQDVVMRVRQEGSDLVLTFKSAGTSVRHEANLSLTEHPEIFSLLNNLCGAVLHKDRFTVLDGDGAYHIDAYLLGHPSIIGKFTVEREFQSVEAMEKWQPPQWLLDCGAVDVTGDKRYLNSSLLENGWPE